MHDGHYDTTARLQVLAADRTTPAGQALIAAAEEFRRALATFLGEWQREYFDGRSMQLPDHFPDILDLFGWTETRLGARARDLNERRNLSFVMATEPLAEAA